MLKKVWAEITNHFDWKMFACVFCITLSLVIFLGAIVLAAANCGLLWLLLWIAIVPLLAFSGAVSN